MSRSIRPRPPDTAMARDGGNLAAGEPSSTGSGMTVYRGKVLRRTFAPGAASEREAVMLKTSSREYVLRRQGQTSYFDPALEEMVGKTVECSGVVHGGFTLFFTNWVEIAPPVDNRKRSL